jgi:putative chitinase
VITLTHDVVQQVTGDAERWFTPLKDAALAWMIDTRPRLTMWLAQCAHESAGYTRLVENLNYSPEGLRRTWPGRFDANLALECAYQPEKIAAVVYQHRMGNTQPGDGWRFRGRGLIMVTGRDRYVECGEALELPLLEKPDLLLRPEHAAASAGWFWYARGCNELADAMDYAGITRRINGGLNGMSDRLERLAAVQAAARSLA